MMQAVSYSEFLSVFFFYQQHSILFTENTDKYTLIFKKDKQVPMKSRKQVLNVKDLKLVLNLLMCALGRMGTFSH